MKKFMLMALLGTMFLSCKKQSSAPNNGVTSTLPQFKYEVILGTTVAKGTYLITWSDSHGNYQVDTTLTNTWTKMVTPNDQSVTLMSVQVCMYNPGGVYVPQGTNVTNTITTNIYKNGVKDVYSTDSFCDPNGGPTCSGNTTKKTWHAAYWQ